MFAEKLKPNDTIGIIAPCMAAVEENYKRRIKLIQSHGFRVKEGKNVYKSTYGYSATEQERADDFNEMISDDEVKMVFFGGGSVGNELLPYIDFENIKRHPKIICSYSDGTTILNTVYAKTGLVTYYGQCPGVFDDMRLYDYRQFMSHFVNGNPGAYVGNSIWKTANGGFCRGVLAGGFTNNFALLVDGKYFTFDPNRKYILFIENNEQFIGSAEFSAHLSHIEQSRFMDSVAGLLVGHYSTKECPALMQRLERFGKKHGIPAVYCDDFGHGVNHAILPVGCMAHMDADKKTMTFHYTE